MPKSAVLHGNLDTFALSMDNKFYSSAVCALNIYIPTPRLIQFLFFFKFLFMNSWKP